MRRMYYVLCLSMVLNLVIPVLNAQAIERAISGEELKWDFRSKITMLKKRSPFFVDRYYTFRGDPSLEINREDWRGYIPIFIDAVEGTFADDDTDIEFVTLHAVEKYGLDITYPEITLMWKKHINRRIWVANYTARQLMSKGLIAPDTGRELVSDRSTACQ